MDQLSIESITRKRLNLENNIICPVCGTKHPKFIEKIKKDDLIYLYKKYFNYHNIAKEVQSDFDFFVCSHCHVKFFHPMFAGSAEYYKFLSQMDWYYLHEDKTELEYAMKYIDSGMKILDVGSGRGVFGKKFLNTNIEYVGLELNQKAVKDAQSDGINVQNIMIEEFALKKLAYFDVVVCFQVLEHISNINIFINACLNALKPNGILIIAVPNNDGFIKYIPNNLLNIPPHHVLQWNEKSLKYLDKKYPIELIDIFKEKVTNIHKKAYILSIMRRCFFPKEQQINMSISNKYLSFTFSIIIKFIHKFCNHINADGQTIIATYRKKI